MSDDIQDLLSSISSSINKVPAGSLSGALEADFSLASTSVSKTPGATSAPLYTETQTVVLAPSTTPSTIISLLNFGAGFLLDCIIYMINAPNLPNQGTNNANTVQLSALSWKGSGQASKVYLSNTNFIFNCKNRDVQSINAINNYSQSITLNIIYTVKSYSDNVEATVDEVTQVIGQIALINSPLPVVQTSTNTTFPAGVKYVLPLTLTNSQATPTGTDFPQLIQFPNALYSIYTNATLSNINFQDGLGNIIPSWMENIGYRGQDTYYWVNLPLGIGAASSLVIYLCFYDLASNVIDGILTGEAPDIPVVWGALDNGASIFTYYTNWSGTSLPPGWVVNAGTGYAVNNQLTFSSSGANLVYIAQIYDPKSYVAESSMYAGFGANVDFQICISWVLYYTGIKYGKSTINPILSNDNGATSDVASTALLTDISSDPVYSLWVDATSSYSLYQYENLTANSVDFAYVGEVNLYIGQLNISPFVGTGYVYWTRIRTLPPNSIMPTDSLGVITIPSLAGIIPPWQVNLEQVGGVPIVGGDLPVVINNSTSILSGQLPVGMTIVQMPTNACKGFVIKADASNTGVIFVGGSGVAIATGFPLNAGEGVSYNATNTNFAYVISDTPSQLIEWTIEN